MNEPAKAYSRTWRPGPQQSSSGPSGRRLRAAAAATALLAVSGALIAWLLYIRPFQRPYFLPLCIGEYDEAFPVRGWVRQDGDVLRGLGWKETNAFTSQQLALLRGELRQLAGHTFDGPLVVYLSAYARATPEGELCLLPVDARLDRPDTWLPLREVFTQLRASKAQHKLLLLDIMQSFLDVRRGLLLNDSAQRLQPVLEEVLAKDPHLSVLCACSPGQVSLTAEELGHSVFAYFLWEGLRGQADGENPRRRHDGRVSLVELANYVTAQVEQWALRQYGVRQSPRLYGAIDDYPLIAVGSSVPSLEEPPLPAEYPEWLSAGWKRRDRWLAEETAPPLLALRVGLETALLRAEKQWRGGFPAERVRRELAARYERLERQRNEQLQSSRSRGLDTVEKVRYGFEETLVQLAGYVPYLEVDDSAEQAWENAAATANQLRRLLDERIAPGSEAGDVWIGRITALTASLRNDPNNLNRLRRPLDRQSFEQLISRRHQGDAADGKVMTALLETPWPRAEQRAKLWSARRELLSALQQKATKTQSAAWSESQAIEAERQRGLRRAQRSLTLLRLRGSDQVEKVEKTFTYAEAMPADDSRLEAVARALRQAWMRENEKEMFR